MKCDKYMGTDVQQAMTVVVVLDADGKVVMETMVPTEAGAMIRLVRSLSGPLQVTFEETTQAAWLHEVIRTYVTEVIVCDPRRNKLLEDGSKADKVDARKRGRPQPGRQNFLLRRQRHLTGRREQIQPT